jgi:hypothetical protein
MSKDKKAAKTGFINYSNHPLASWSAEQRAAAEAKYTKVVDKAFPAVPPAATMAELEGLLATELAALFVLIEANTPASAPYCDVHIMGEQSFCFNIIEALHEEGIRCFVSTSARNTQELPNGEKLVQFKFVQFRPYANYDALIAEAKAELDEIDDIMTGLQADLALLRPENEAKEKPAKDSENK